MMYLFTSETVSPGHPDKCADIIAGNIVDTLLLIGDSQSRVASEVFVAGNNVIIGGEVTSKTKMTYKPLEETFLYADVTSRSQVCHSDYPLEQLDELKLFEELKV